MTGTTSLASPLYFSHVRLASDHWSPNNCVGHRDCLGNREVGSGRNLQPRSYGSSSPSSTSVEGLPHRDQSLQARNCGHCTGTDPHFGFYINIDSHHNCLYSLHLVLASVTLPLIRRYHLSPLHVLFQHHSLLRRTLSFPILFFLH